MDRKIERPIPIYIYKTYQGLELFALKGISKVVIPWVIIYFVLEFLFKNFNTSEDELTIIFLFGFPLLCIGVIICQKIIKGYWFHDDGDDDSYLNV